MAEYLVEIGIDSISVTPDTLLAVTRQVLAVEQRLGRAPRAPASLLESSS
jgi:pyruvate,water dikinase